MHDMRDGTADRILCARTERGMTQAELADAAGIDASAVSRYERGVTEPRAYTLLALAVALGTTTDYLVGLTNKGLT
jgi:transcriptional regulator with XRE-family HTH domain